MNEVSSPFFELIVSTHCSDVIIRPHSTFLSTPALLLCTIDSAYQFIHLFVLIFFDCPILLFTCDAHTTSRRSSLSNP
jgi:hypothetical protein